MDIKFNKARTAPLLAEFLGTSVLVMMALVLSQTTAVAYFIGTSAALALGVVYMMFSGVSGGHFNPAITIGVWATRKITQNRTVKAIAYIVAQVLGALASWQLYQYFTDQKLVAQPVKFVWPLLVAEAVGTLILALGFATAASRAFSTLESALTYGFSLFVGIMVAATASAAFLNPAKHKIDVEPIIKRLVGNVELRTKIVHQSPEIASGVDTGGAGDQGIMVGYATAETPELLPLEVMLARQLNQKLFERWPYDGKTQVTLKEGKIVALVASFQHTKSNDLKMAVNSWLRDKSHAGKVAIYANPAGEWDQGGFDADSGLTGRKLVVDNYGPQIPVGGGCFSGKDATKVDRSGAYMARRIAVDYLIKHKAREVYCYLAYAIGVAEPLEAVIRIDGKTHKVKGYDLTPKGIIGYLNLKKPQYEQTARYGHFGHGFAWDD